MEKLATLLAHRRIPGEHSLRRRSERSGQSVARDPDINEVHHLTLRNVTLYRAIISVF